MGENKGKGDEKEKKGGGSEKKKEGGVAEKKEEGPPKVVLKIDMHCEGCASKIKRCIKGFEGVEGVALDMENNKVTVIGTVDLWKLRDHVEAKTRKNVEIVSPANPPKKDAGGGKTPAASDGKKPASNGKKPADGDKNPADGDKKPAAAGDKKPAAAGDSKDKKKPDDRKSKEPAASSVVLKIRLHCDGCIQRIKKTILKIKGVQDVSIDAQKDLVTVKGTMDVISLPPNLKGKLNRGVEIVSVTTGGGGGGGGSEKKDKPATPTSGGGPGGGEKKEKGAGGGGGGGGGGGEKKGNGAGGGGGGGGGGGEKKGNDAGGGGENKGNGGGGVEKKGKDGGGGGKKEEVPSATVSAAAMPVMEANKMDYYYDGPYSYRPEMMHAPQLFSDENPNSCSVM